MQQTKWQTPSKQTELRYDACTRCAFKAWHSIFELLEQPLNVQKVLWKLPKSFSWVAQKKLRGYTINFQQFIFKGHPNQHWSNNLARPIHIGLKIVTTHPHWSNNLSRCIHTGLTIYRDASTLVYQLTIQRLCQVRVSQSWMMSFM